MSWEIVNQILGLAAVNQEFAQALLKEPLAAIQKQGFRLTSDELRVLSEVSPKNLRELSQCLIRELNHEKSEGD
jgi:hypothetical protein